MMLRATFAGGDTGSWKVREARAIVGHALAPADRLAVHEGIVRPVAEDEHWALAGTTSHLRYVERAEKQLLDAAQPALGRVGATHAAFIPIAKNADWWALAQDERRAILEDRSHHISATQRFLPAVARRLYHARELGGPFDFLTWFEFAPRDEGLFDELLAMLRATEEWRYVEREVELRLAREE
jgi:hypothetical protein